jgi:hypothetical protein
MKHIRTRIRHGTNRGLAATDSGKAIKAICGFSEQDLRKALTGDQDILKRLGEVRKEGELVATLLPGISETIKSKIKNEKDWNLFIAEYVKQGTDAASAIDKAKFDSRMAISRYNHKRVESIEQFQGARELEKGRHQFAIDYNRAKIYADLVFQQVDGEVSILDQKARVKLRQQTEDRKHLIATSEYLLEQGEEANLELIQKRDYSQTAGLFQRLGRSIKNLIGV